jgi:MurNAc alpha-1-phosphate uridylyltransferase
MKPIDVKIKSEQDMADFGADMASLLPPHTVLLLSGDLGAGKTVFARGFIRAALGTPSSSVTSPTFNMVSIYDTSTGPVYHYDLYRVKDPSEIDELNIDDVYSARATLIEWPDRLPEKMPPTFKKWVDIQITIAPNGTREITITPYGFGVFPDTSFIFAAGLGTRMRDRVRDVPKPLVMIAGRPTLDYFMDQAHAAGITRLFLNTHYLPQKIEDFTTQYRNRFDIKTFYEPVLLETGGGLKNALPSINRDIFFAMNGDALIDEGGGLPMLDRLSLAFDPEKMDILLLLFPVNRNSITKNVGDYKMDQDGRLTRSLNLTGTHMFAGIRMLHARVFDTIEDGVFSFREQMDSAERAGRLFGLVHTGLWHHISTPEDVDSVSTYITDQNNPPRSAVATAHQG